MKKRMISSYTSKDHKLTEKRNLFPDLAGAGGFYIPGRRQEEDETEEEVTEMSFVMNPSTPSTNEELISPVEAEMVSRPETCFLVGGTVEERRCAVQHTEV